MNKSLWIIGAIIIFSGIVAYVALNKRSALEPSTEIPAAQEVNEGRGPQSLVELLGASGSQRCAFMHQEANSYSEGIVYVSDGMMRGDFTSVSAGQTFNSHLVAKGGMTYTWMDDIDVGFRAPISESAPSASAESGVDLYQKVDYACEPWSAEGALFELPTSITFTDTASFAPPSAR